MPSPPAFASNKDYLGPISATPQKMVEEMLRMAGVSADDVVFDLGCNDGRVCITAAREHGARGVGIEIDAGAVNKAKRLVSTKAERAGRVFALALRSPALCLYPCHRDAVGSSRHGRILRNREQERETAIHAGAGGRARERESYSWFSCRLRVACDVQPPVWRVTSIRLFALRTTRDACKKEKGRKK